ncbi:MAG TPA: DUF2269 family protein [Candidatus Eisenbacteria bacterium]|nr:DUF2269 family protein [Candidatus Eisenbacteria bacterium]
MLVTIIKFIHILAAIVAVGMNISYGVWIIRAQRDPSHTAFALKGIKFIDDRIANPAYGVLLVTGLLMVFLIGYKITTLWIAVALVLFVALIVVAATQYTPTLRNQVKLAEAGDTTSPEFSRLAKRGQTLGQALGVIVVLILAMMVFKPTL